MKKIILSSLLAIGMTGFMVSNVSAAAFDNTVNGGTLTITTGNVATASGSLTFDPSTKVRISGASDDTSFAFSAYHTAVPGKKAGQAYGMAADSNKQYVLDIGPDGDDQLAQILGDASDTNSTAFGNLWVSI